MDDFMDDLLTTTEHPLEAPARPKAAAAKPKTKKRKSTKKHKKTPKSSSSSSSSRHHHRKKAKSNKEASVAASMCIDANAVGGAPATLDLTLGTNGKKTKAVKRVREVKPSEPRMSETVAAMRDTARRGIPEDARDRILTADSVSYLSADPVRDEEKATLASMASGSGTKLDDEVQLQLVMDSAVVLRRAGRRKKKARVSHRLSDLPDKDAWGPNTPSEKQAQAGMLPEAREIDKHPGKVKTAGLGVAVPPPGAHQTHLRKLLDASSLSRQFGDRPPPPPPETSGRNVKEWQTASTTEIAAELDQARMGISGAVRPVLPIAELKAVLSDQNRLSLADARTTLARYFAGLVENKCLEIDAAARLMRGNSMQGSSSSSSSSTSSKQSVPRRSRRGAGRVLILDESQQDIMDSMCGDMDTTPDDSVPIPEDPSMACALPRVGLGQAIDAPLDEIEVAVLTGSALRDAMAYFMRFDDSVQVMERVYETSLQLANLPGKMEALRHKSRSGLSIEDRKAMIQGLEAHELALDKQWQDGLTTSSSSSQQGEAEDNGLNKTWCQRASVRVLLAILTGKLDNQRHNIVRTLVAREETLLELYHAPSQRCFLGDDKGVESDTDVLNLMRRMLGNQAATKGAERVVLPDLGTPATKAYCADFLRAPNPRQNLERPCVNGEHACIAWILAAHASWPATGSLNRASHAFVMREFYAPDKWQAIQKTKSLPMEHNECLLCSRMTTTYYWIQLRLLDARGVVGLRDELRTEAWRGSLLGQTHCNAIEPEHGYSESDLLPVCRPTDGPWTGVVQPFVAFRANAYVPGECVAPIDLSRRQEVSRDSSSSSSSSNGGGNAILPCFYERTTTDFR